MRCEAVAEILHTALADLGGEGADDGTDIGANTGADGGGVDGGAGGGADGGMDPVLGVLIRDGARWTSASVLRTLEGFDAECLLAAARPPAEAAYFSTLVLARSMAVASRGSTSGELLLGLLRPGSLAPPSARLVALEALGAHATARWRDGGVAAAAPSLRFLIDVVRAPHSDAGTRALACRALAHVASGAPAALELVAEDGPGAVGALAIALASDPDRYVRGYAAEALASVAVARGRSSPCGQTAAGALASCLVDRASARSADATRVADPESDDETAEVLQLCTQAGSGGGASPSGVVVRWLCARRRCPLTTPSSPF